MQVIEAPNLYPTPADIFLGGGITNCPDWQSEIIDMFRRNTPRDEIILNPRRTGAFTEDIAGEQIEWEYHALRSVKTVFFWFPKETLCPITLLELGVFTQMPHVNLIVGTHPDYARRFDVIKQLELARPEVNVKDTLRGMYTEYLWSLMSDDDEGKDEQKIQAFGAGAITASNVLTEQQEYARVKKIVKDELDFMIGMGTVDELKTVVGDNYPNVKARHLKEAIRELQGHLFALNHSGVIIPPEV